MEERIYQVWALGWVKTEEGEECTDCEEFLGEFHDEKEAAEHADKYKDMSYIYDQNTLNDMDPEEYLEVRIEVMEPIPEDEQEDLGPDDEAYEVVDIIYSRNIYFPEEKNNE